MKKKNRKLIGAATLAIACLGITLFAKCKNENGGRNSGSQGKDIDTTSTKDSLATKQQDSTKTSVSSNAGITYTAFIIPKEKREKDSAMAAFMKDFSAKERYTILAINRLDNKNRWRADTLAVPNKLDVDFLAYSPFPQQLPVLKDVNKFVFFSYPIQAFAYYENGNLAKWGPTSMGKKTAQTKRGLTFTNWKKQLAISTVNDEWKLPHNVNIHNRLGIGWHEYELPGYPASHSCLRMLAEDAKWMYEKADTWLLSSDGQNIIKNGTPVIVHGDYAWGAQKPWKRLPEDPNATTISENEMTEIIQPNLEKILSEQQKRQQ